MLYYDRLHCLHVALPMSILSLSSCELGATTVELHIRTKNLQSYIIKSPHDRR